MENWRKGCGFRAVVSAALSVSAVVASADATPPPEHLRCEYLDNPRGIDVERPRLSWWIQGSRRGERQTAWQVLAATSPELLAKEQGDLWDSGKVASDQSIHVEYAGAPMRSQIRCWWKVRIWNMDGIPTPWSAVAQWSMGLLKPEEWAGQWIGLDRGEQAPASLGEAQWIWYPEGNAATSAPAEKRFFRRVVNLPADRRVTAAAVVMTADDGFTLLVNGVEMCRSEGHPNVVTADVAARLRPGANVFAVIAYNKTGPPQNPAGLIGSLRITFAEGEPLDVITDGQWRSAKTEGAQWTGVDFDDSRWLHAGVLGKYGMAPWGVVAAGSDHRRLPARYLRREFTIGKEFKHATAYMSGLGFSELYLNGRKVDIRVMDPTQSRYDKRVMYVTFDVAEYLRNGRNAAGVILGNGRFFAPRVVIPAATPTFGFPKLLFQMSIEYTDGTSELIVSDKDWKITDQGPIRANSEFDGEEYDARMEMSGWDREGFDDSNWPAVQSVAAPRGKLVAQMLEPMRVIETLKPVAIDNPRPGIYVAAFGQNLYGMTRIKVNGPRDTRVVIRTTFDRHPDGMIDMAPNRSSLSTDIYTLKGEGVESWSPRFRGQGTRHAEITGWPGVPTTKDLELLVVHSDLEKAGDFSCSEELVNKIHASMRRTVRMQERGVPMDPDRDERQAWLSVSEKTSETEGCLYNVAAFYTNFLAETRIDQREDGCLSDAGSFWPWSQSGDPCWPAVVTTTPWSCWLMYGDRRILADNYFMMKRWVEFLEKRVDADFIYRKGNYGDWVDAYSMDGKPDNGATSRPLLWTAYFYYNCNLAARIAEFLGHLADAAHFRTTAEKTGVAFNKVFFDPKSDTYESKTQTSYVLPLAFGLTPPERRQAVADNLVKDILVAHNGHLSVGCVGMKWLMQTLTDIGRTDVAWTILTQTTRPGWGYMISKDGTSIWERWDRDTRDPGMNGQSQTILAGYLGAWMFQTLGGINYDPARPGFRHIILRPQLAGDLTWVTASHRSPYGNIRSEWRIAGNKFLWTVNIPPNTTAEVVVPAKSADSITESGEPAARAPGVRLLHVEPGAAVFSVESGSYSFAASR
jgi:alpha-L-rhamnosidase